MAYILKLKGSDEITLTYLPHRSHCMGYPRFSTNIPACHAGKRYERRYARPAQPGG